MIHLGDITKINGAEIEPVDIITGGSPCQDLSVAGKRAGLAGQRSGLFMEQIRVVKEMREHEKANGRAGCMVRPRWMVWENVPGAFSSNFKFDADGRGFGDFGAVLEEICRVCEPGFSLPRLPKKCKWTKAGAILGDGWSVAWRTHDAQFWGVPQRRKRISVVADFGGQCAAEVLFERKSVPGNPEPGESQREEVAGYSGTGVERNDSVLGQTVAFTQNQREEVRNLGDKSGTVAAEPGIHQQTYVLQGSMIGRADKNGPQGDGINEGVSFTLNATDHHAVVYDARGNGDGVVAPTLTGDHESRITDYTAVAVSYAKDLNGGNPACNQGGVAVCERILQWIARRLMPIECERLQGFPDNWTDIGEWTDSKGRKRKTTDGARYMALGNSIALPFWKHLLANISATYDRPATLGSLFDGIGGFPLCHEEINGKGTAKWASEIEEFPIAVTKVRFPDNDGNNNG